jgi:hypothetical protein
MRIHKLNTLLSALAVGVCVTTAGAQTAMPYPPAQTATPYPPTDEPREVIVVQPSPPPAATGESAIIVPPRATPQPDPSAESKCRYAAPSAYWDCVNSHNGGP